MLVLLFLALWFILRGICFKSCLVLFCSCVFCPFSIAITSLGEETANFSAFCTFVGICMGLFGFVCFLFPVVSGKGRGLSYWHSLDISLTFCVRIILSLSRSVFLITLFF